MTEKAPGACRSSPAVTFAATASGATSATGSSCAWGRWSAAAKSQMNQAARTRPITIGATARPRDNDVPITLTSGTPNSMRVEFYTR